MSPYLSQEHLRRYLCTVKAVLTVVLYHSVPRLLDIPGVCLLYIARSSYRFTYQLYLGL